jgi:hypothetical protein
MLGIPTWL